MQQHVTFVGKKSKKSFLKIKIIKKLENNAILYENTKLQHIVFVI